MGQRTRAFEAFKELNNTASGLGSATVGGSFPSTFYVRFTSDGTTVQAQRSDNGTTWTNIGNATNLSGLTNPKVGMYATASPWSGQAKTASFDYFTLDAPQEVTFDRSDDGQSMDLTWYLIEFTDKTSVQAGSEQFGGSDTTQNVPITSVNTAKSFAVGGASMQEGRANYTSSDNPGVGWMTHELTTSTNLRITRARDDGSTAYIGWFVVTIPKAVIVTPVSGLTTTEAGGTATFTVKLDAAPTANVTIALSSSDIDRGHGQSGVAHLHHRQLEHGADRDGDRRQRCRRRRESELHHRHRRAPAPTPLTTG